MPEAKDKPGPERKPRRRRREERTLGAGEFKAVCLRLMDEVRETGAEYVITKRGRAVAKLGPASEELRPFVGRSRGVITASREDLLAPLDEDFEVGADL